MSYHFSIISNRNNCVFLKPMKKRKIKQVYIKNKILTVLIDHNLLANYKRTFKKTIVTINSLFCLILKYKKLITKTRKGSSLQKKIYLFLYLFLRSHFNSLKLLKINKCFFKNNFNFLKYFNFSNDDYEKFLLIYPNNKKILKKKIHNFFFLEQFKLLSFVSKLKFNIFHKNYILFFKKKFLLYINSFHNSFFFYNKFNQINFYLLYLNSLGKDEKNIVTEYYFDMINKRIYSFYNTIELQNIYRFLLKKYYQKKLYINYRYIKKLDFVCNSLLFTKFLLNFLIKGRKKFLLNILYTLNYFLKLYYGKNFVLIFIRLIFLAKDPITLKPHFKSGRILFYPHRIAALRQISLVFVKFKKSVLLKKDQQFFNCLLQELFEFVLFERGDFIKKSRQDFFETFKYIGFGFQKKNIYNLKTFVYAKNNLKKTFNKKNKRMHIYEILGKNSIVKKFKHHVTFKVL